MARGINKVILVGNLGNDPEVRYSQSGAAITKISVATSESWKDKNGEQQERTEWHRVTFFGKLAEIAGEYLKKGRQVYVEGALRTEKYTDKNGVEKYSTDIIGNEMQMLGGMGGGGEGGERAERPQRSSGAGAPRSSGGVDRGGSNAPRSGGNAPMPPSRNDDPSALEMHQWQAYVSVLQAELIQHKFGNSGSSPTGMVREELITKKDANDYLDKLQILVQQQLGTSITSVRLSSPP